MDKGPEVERAYYTVYGNLGLYDKAVEYLGRAVEMVHRIFSTTQQIKRP